MPEDESSLRCVKLDTHQEVTLVAQQIPLKRFLSLWELGLTVRVGLSKSFGYFCRWFLDLQEAHEH